MKKFKILLLVLIMIFAFLGCSSFRLSTSIDDLISPVSPSGENDAVKTAVEQYCKNGYLIKIPSSGEYTTSFIFYDLNNDGENEAIAFYEPSDKLGTIDMAVLNKQDDNWKVVYNVTGNGTDVNSVDFCDVNNDGEIEILVCWSLISKSTNFNLDVYRQISDDSGYSLEPIGDSVTAGEFICADVNEDGVTDVLVFSFGSSTLSPTARLYSYSSNSRKLIGETKLDGSINSFSSIVVGETDQGVSVYADAVRSDGDSMVTELIYWSNYYDSIVSPFYSYSTGRTSDTARQSMIDSKDIDGDGVIEIPTDAKRSKLPQHLTAQDWMVYGNTVLTHKCYTVSCKRDSYSVVLSKKQLEDYTFKYDVNTRKLIVYDGKNMQFEIVTVFKSAYDSQNYSGYSEIYSNNGFVYLAKTGSNSESDITVNDLKNIIKPY